MILVVTRTVPSVDFDRPFFVGRITNVVTKSHCTESGSIRTREQVR